LAPLVLLQHQTWQVKFYACKEKAQSAKALSVLKIRKSQSQNLSQFGHVFLLFSH